MLNKVDLEYRDYLNELKEHMIKVGVRRFTAEVTGTWSGLDDSPENHGYNLISELEDWTDLALSILELDFLLRYQPKLLEFRRKQH